MPLTFPEPKAEPLKPVEVSKLGEEPIKLEEKPQEEEVKIEPPLSEVVKNSLKNRLKGKPDAPEEKKEPEVKPEPEVKEEKKEEPKKKAAPKAKEPAPVIDPHQIAAEAARAAVDLSRPVKKEEPKPEKPDPLDQLPEHYREDVPVLQAMEKRFPDKYKGLTQKFIAGAVKIEQYRDQWEKANPGKEFNPEEEEHTPFFERHEATWEDKDYARAMAAMEAESAAERERRKYSKELDELRSKDLERDLEPVIRKIQGDISRNILTEIDKSFDGLVDERGNVVRAVAEKLQEEDPIRFEIAMSEAAALSRFVRETERLFHPSGKFGFDDQNPTHKEIYDFAMNQEGRLSRLPAADQRNGDGQMFATRAEYRQMTPEQQKRFWQLEKDDLQFLRAEITKERAKKFIAQEDERIRKIIEKRGLVPKEGKKEEAKKPEEPVAKEKPDGPSGATGGKIASSASGPNGAPSDPISLFKNALRGR